MGAPSVADLWLFRARLVRVTDGDTVVLQIDQGFGEGRLATPIRLLGVNAPEKNRAASRVAGLAARDFVVGWMQQATGDWPLLVRTSQNAEDKYGGRYDGRVYRCVDGACLNTDLLAAGHAVPFAG